MYLQSLKQISFDTDEEEAFGKLGAPLGVLVIGIISSEVYNVHVRASCV